MSTFDGIIHEFPDIRVDYFRRHDDRPPALACFLSHIHSDHLAGLESLKSPFVYCSPATREMLLRLEKYPGRILYAKGIVETRKQTFKHLKNILKPLPLETPITLELSPGNSLQVTLIDANHCPGSVMFLFETPSSSALYTGDMRSEPWWVSTVTRNPCLAQYSAGLRVIDTIYIDNSFTHDVPFQTKGEGLAELVTKVAKYPSDTIFYVQAWTYGYEDVWVALSKALNSQVHVDKYKHRMYTCLRAQSQTDRFSPVFHLTKEAPALIGFRCGNTDHPGCLTDRTNVRIHSCEKGNVCDVVQKGPVVTIQPIVTRLTDGYGIDEVGIGGGGEDLEREVELAFAATEEITPLLDMVAESKEIPEELRANVRQLLQDAVRTGRGLGLDLNMDAFGDKNEAGIREALKAMATGLIEKTATRRQQEFISPHTELPKVITFPYSRHSSYPEQCHLVQSLTPRDVWPCTVDPNQWMQDDMSISKLFGKFCSGTNFKHDTLMRQKVHATDSMPGHTQPSQATTASLDDLDHALPDLLPNDPQVPSNCSTLEGKELLARAKTPIVDPREREVIVIPDDTESEASMANTQPSLRFEILKRSCQEFSAEAPGRPKHIVDESTKCLVTFDDEIHRKDIWDRAFWTTIANTNSSGSNWAPLGLLSTTDHHTKEDQDLGEL